MGANIHGENCIAIEVKYASQVTLNHHGINRSFVESGETMNFMSPQPTIKWIRLKNNPCLSGGFFLTGRETIKAFPKLLGSPKMVRHGA